MKKNKSESRSLPAEITDKKKEDKPKQTKKSKPKKMDAYVEISHEGLKIVRA